MKRILKLFLFIDILQGLSVTLCFLLRRPITLQYPDEKTPVSSRFRGIHALRRYDNGTERCIGCRLCESICPAMAIKIESEPAEDGTRRTTVYDIDLFKCIFCGLCEEACPVDAIVETDMHEYHMDRRGQNILDKKRLLAIGDIYDKRISNNLNINEKYI